MTFTSLNEYIAKPKCISEISNDRDGNLLQQTNANKCHLYEKFTNQNILYINLKSSQLLYEDKTNEMVIKLRKNILQKLRTPGHTLKDSLYGAEFYCSSGILTKLAVSHLQHKSINISCIKIEGVIVMIDSDKLEQKQTLFNNNIRFSSSDTEKTSEKNCPAVKDSNYDKILKYTAFLKKNSTNDKPVFLEGVKAWKQYRRVYITDLRDPDNLNTNRPLKVAYNSIIHCVDEKTEKPILIKTRPSYIEEDNFTWRPNQASKMYLESVLLDCDKIAVGEWDKEYIIHHTKITTPEKVLEKSNLDGETLCKNLCLVLRMIKHGFEVDNDRVKYVRITKWSVSDKFHVKSFANVPKDELCIKVFDNF